MTLCGGNRSIHDDVIKWKHFPRYWPFVRGIHREFTGHRSQRPVTRSFDVFFDLCLNKRLSKQSRGWWFETPSRPLWHHCNGQMDFCWYPIICVKSLQFILKPNTLRFHLWVPESHELQWLNHMIAGLILGLHPTNERRRYKVTPSLIGWVQA